MPVLMRAGFDAAIGVSETTLREVHAAYGFRGRSIAIPNGVDFARLDSGPVADDVRLPSGGIRLVWVGALGPQKRPDVAVQVMRLLPPDTSLTIVGEGPWRDQVVAAVVAAGLQDRVVLTGNRENVGAIMRAGDLLLMTSDTEGIPGVALEAQHCGLPVVAFAVGGLQECVPSAGPGALVPHGDLSALAAAIIRVAGQLSCPRVRDQCRAFAEGFSIEQIGPKYLEFYAEQRRRRSTTAAAS
jgi:glycosyltransferase involved in cell wall biosynthesis